MQWRPGLEPGMAQLMEQGGVESNRTLGMQYIIKIKIDIKRERKGNKIK